MQGVFLFSFVCVGSWVFGIVEVLLDFGGFRVLGLCFSVLGAKGMVHRNFFFNGCCV
jgi:hypothetical protein